MRRRRRSHAARRPRTALLHPGHRLRSRRAHRTEASHLRRALPILVTLTTTTATAGINEPALLPTYNPAATRGFSGCPLQESANSFPSAFDLLRLSGTLTTRWPYLRRRAALESVFTARQLFAPWALCPSTTDPDTVREWLSWASVGMEGVVLKRLTDTYKRSSHLGGSVFCGSWWGSLSGWCRTSCGSCS
ncbi:hypothetical protein ACPCTH_33605, partial [Streptomyces cellulosae]